MIKLLCIFRLLIIKILCNYTSPYLSSDKIKPGIKAKVLLFLIITACIIPIYGQESHPCADTCTINGNYLIHGQLEKKKHPGHFQIVYFRFDQAKIDSGYTDNRDGLQALDALFSDSARVSLIDSVHIYAYASPEGRESYNNKLAALRAASIKEYLMEHYLLLKHCSINLFPQGENWEGMRELILRDKGFDEWQEVIMILDRVKESHKREALIKYLNGGKAYAYIKEHILPLLRNAAVCTVWVNDRLMNHNLPSLSMSGRDVLSMCHCRPDRQSVNTPIKLYAEIAGRAGNDNGFIGNDNGVVNSFRHNPNKRRYSALKTNLINWAAGCVNLSYETQIGKHFSIDLPLMWSSWDISKKHALRIIAIQPELRYWFTTPGRGHFMGVHAHAARYNLKWNNDRYQDTGRPLLGGGVGYGYSLPFNDTWAVEFNLGVGYANTKYNLYHNVDNGSLFDTRILNYWGITRFGISFIYKLPQP